MYFQIWIWVFCTLVEICCKELQKVGIFDIFWFHNIGTIFATIQTYNKQQ